MRQTDFTQFSTILKKVVSTTKQSAIGISLLIALSPLYGCSGLGYTPPPGAKVGDAFLNLSIATNNASHMPQGADIVISIENPTAIDDQNKVIIGDVIKLSQSDTGVKINFPIDRHLLSECGKSKPCQIHVKIAKSGSIQFISKTPVPIKAGQTKASITVSRI